jgi:hypothetical protein
MDKFDLLGLGVQFKDAYESTAKSPNARVPRVLAFVVLYGIGGSGLVVVENTIVTLYIFDKDPLEREDNHDCCLDLLEARKLGSLVDGVLTAQQRNHQQVVVLYICFDHAFIRNYTYPSIDSLLGFIDKPNPGTT